jgi:hypothetical protein
VVVIENEEALVPATEASFATAHWALANAAPPKNKINSNIFFKLVGV